MWEKNAKAEQKRLEKEIQRQNAFYYVISTCCLILPSFVHMPLFTGTNTYPSNWNGERMVCAPLYHCILNAIDAVQSIAQRTNVCVCVCIYKYSKVHKSMKYSVDSTVSRRLCTKFCFDHFGSYVVVDSVCWQRLHWTDSTVAIVITRRFF